MISYEEKQEIIAYGKGKTAREIANHFNLPMSVAYYYIQVLRVETKKSFAGRKSKFSDKEEFRKFCSGKTVDEIAEHYKTDRRSVYANCKMLGVKFLPFKYSKYKYKGLIEYYKDHTIKECADHFRVSYQTMEKVLRANNLLITKDKVNEVKSRNGSPVCTRVRKIELFNKMVKTLSETYSIDDIATVFNYSSDYIIDICNNFKEKTE